MHVEEQEETTEISEQLSSASTSTEEDCEDGDEEIEWKGSQKSCSWLLEGKNVVNCATNEDFQRVCKKSCGVCDADSGDENAEEEEEVGEDLGTDITETEDEGSNNTST